jgi:biopolymer transport protein ExbB
MAGAIVSAMLLAARPGLGQAPGETGPPATAAAVTDTTTLVAATEHPETYLDFALAGGYLMIPIGLSSVLLVAFFAERLVAIRRSRVLPKGFVAAIEGASSGGSFDREKAAAACESHPSSAARILRAALGRIEGPRVEIESAVNNAAQREIHSMRRYTRLFAIIAAVAPLIGLLGTVIGMIQAFREVAIQGLGSGQALAPGIYKALVTTAGGLLVAIPALIAYHWLRSRIDNYVQSIDNLVVDCVEAGTGRQP